MALSLVWLIAIGLLITDVKADIFRSSQASGSPPAFGQTVDDAGKGSLEEGEDDVKKETSEYEARMAELQEWKNKLDALRLGVGIFAEGYKLYSRVSANYILYEKFKKGEVSKEEFEFTFWKDVRDVVRNWCLKAGKAAGKSMVELLIPGVWRVVGDYIGDGLGKICGDILTGKAADDIEKNLVLRKIGSENGDTGMLVHALRLLTDFLGTLVRAFDIVIKSYPRVSVSYERWANGEISLKDFQWDVLKEVGKNVVKVGTPMAGTFAGATVGAWYVVPAFAQMCIPIPGVGVAVGAYFGTKLGGMVVEFVTGED